GCCDTLFDIELRTACRRLLARIAARDAAALQRGRAETAASAIVWSIARANNAFESWGTGPYVRDLETYFALAPSTASQRASTLLRAAALPVPEYGSVHLAAPELLVSRERRRLMKDRDRHLEA
ncbi:MAG: DUF6398 domain-containing protein, partial [Acidimicrobiia bacterium]